MDGATVIAKGTKISYNDQEAIHDAVARAPEMAYSLTGGVLEHCVFPNADWATTVTFTKKSYTAISDASGRWAATFTMLPFADVAVHYGSIDNPTGFSAHGANWYTTVVSGQDYNASTVAGWRPVAACVRMVPTQNNELQAGQIAGLSCVQVPSAASLLTIASIMAEPYSTSAPFSEGMHMTLPHGPMRTETTLPRLVKGAGDPIAYWSAGGTYDDEYFPGAYHWDPEIFRMFGGRGVTNNNLVFFGHTRMWCMDPSDHTIVDTITGLSLVPRAQLVVAGLATASGPLISASFAELTIVRIDEWMNSGTLTPGKPVTFLVPATTPKQRAHQAATASAGEVALGAAGDFVQEHWRDAAGLALQAVGMGANVAGDLGLPGVGAIGRGLNFIGGLL